MKWENGEMSAAVEIIKTLSSIFNRWGKTKWFFYLIS